MQSPRPNTADKKHNGKKHGPQKRFRKIIAIAALIVSALFAISVTRPEGLDFKPSPADLPGSPKSVQSLRNPEHPEHGLDADEENENTPESIRVEKIKAWWAFTFVTIIIVFSVSFESAVEYVRHAVPEELQEVIAALLEELTTLGFLGFAFFLTTVEINDQPSLIESLSLYSLHEREALAELFEGLHYLVFTISLSYIFCTLGGMYEFQYGEGGSVSWKRYDEAGKSAAGAAEYLALLQA
jgi:hypothetical protein